jgi:hypothetical protein
MGVLDPPIRGQHYNGTSEGVLRVKSDQADFVLVAPQDNNWSQIGAGGTISFLSGPGAGAEGSPLGVPFCWYTNLASGTDLHQLALRTTFVGKVFGLCYRNSNGASFTVPTFACVIDGETFPVGTPISKFQNLLQGGGSPKADLWAFTLLADDLPDCQHTVDVVFTADPTLSFRSFIYGFALDKRYYNAPVPRMTMLDAQAITVSAVALTLTAAIPTGISGLTTLPDRNLRYARQLRFTNSAVAAGVVTLAKAGTTIDTIQVPANAGAGTGVNNAVVWDPGGLMALDASYTVKGSATGMSINVVGGWA